MAWSDLLDTCWRSRQTAAVLNLNCDLFLNRFNFASQKHLFGDNLDENINFLNKDQDYFMKLK